MMPDRVRAAKRSQPQWLSIWVIAGAVVVCILLTAILLIVIGLSSPESTTPAPSTAVFNVIPAPTSTLASQSIFTATPSDDVAGTPPSPPTGTITVGSYVQISGTGGNGLRLREGPGLAHEVRLLGSEAEVFRIDDGPRESDGYTWWYLVGPFDETRHGWAVSNFLVVTQNP